MGKIHAVGLFIIGIAVLSVLMLGFYYFSGLFDIWALVTFGELGTLEIYWLMAGHTFVAILVLWPLYTFWISTMRKSYWNDD